MERWSPRFKSWSNLQGNSKKKYFFAQWFVWVALLGRAPAPIAGDMGSNPATGEIFSLKIRNNEPRTGILIAKFSLLGSLSTSRQTEQSLVRTDAALINEHYIE